MELKDPPFSTADLHLSADDIAAAGAKWRQVPDDVLVGLLGREASTAAAFVLEGAQAELARRTVDEQRTLEAAMRASIAEQQKLRTAVDASGDAAGRQNEHMIRLTQAIYTLTWVLLGVGVLQVLLAVFRR